MYPPKYEYLVVKSREYVDGVLMEVDVLAQVQKIVMKSPILSEDMDVKTIELILNAGIDEVNVIGFAKILGYIVEKQGGKRIYMPRRAVIPGNKVYIAPSNLLKKFFSYDESEGLYIGNLILRPDVPVYISINGFRRHLAILAQTGAGKSYTAGVLMEELLKKCATIVAIDPHSDYVFLSRRKDNTRFELWDRITVYRNPNSTGRYSVDELDNVKPYTIKFSDLSYDEVCNIAGIPEKYTNIRQVIRVALEQLKRTGKEYTAKDLFNVIEKYSEFEREELKNMKISLDAVIRSLKYVERLLRLKVFGDRSVDIMEILKPCHLADIDLSGLDDKSMDYIASRILRDIYIALRDGLFRHPVFIFIEEAHKFIPPKGGPKTYSKEIINTLAAEGRKFGAFLILISQRPCKIDSDSLSQCNSQIIMKMTNPQDQIAVRESSERVSEDLINDLPGLNPGEAVIVGEVTRIPVMVKIRERITREGGADIDVVNALKQVREKISLEIGEEKKVSVKKGIWSEI
ncbi:MAG TPA: ATP-binding protein [Thermoprotei archaeon]|nr:ATP-binding protein [Thermoprotei archaeon]